MLGTKFKIEGMYEEIYTQKRENEELLRIWERVQWTGPAQGSGGGGMMHLRRLLPIFLAACGQSGSKFVAWCRSAMRAITWAVPAISIATATEIVNEGRRRGDEGLAQKYGCSTEWDGW